MNMIKNNWEHYRRLYKISAPAYRNDYALSIALNIVNGHTLNLKDIPWNLASLTPEHKLSQTAIDEIKNLNKDNIKKVLLKYTNKLKDKDKRHQEIMNSTLSDFFDVKGEKAL